METKNEKGVIEWSIGNIIIIVLSITMLLLGMILIKGIFEKPEFKITEEVCYKEEIIINVSMIDNETYKATVRSNGKGTITISNPLDCINGSYCIGYETVCEYVEVDLEYYKDWDMDDCYEKYWSGNSSYESDEYKNYMICTNLLSSQLHKLIVSMRDGKEFKNDIEFYLDKIGCELNKKCGDYKVEVLK